MSKEDFIIPIPGTTSIENMKANFEAGEIKLFDSTVNEIDELLSVIAVPVFGGHK